VVDTASGRVRGYIDRDVYAFKGVPYGAPPVGQLRFMPPAKPRPWTNIRNSLQYGAACPQPAGRVDDLNQFFFEFDRGYQDEDCLSLNVWSPGVNDNRKRPVMVWLHGGGFVTGSAFELPSYDGRNLARRGDVVVVSVNHRLNVFGFLYLGSLGEPYATSVNAGMLDIVAALAWVRDNIAAFGGDASNVTVFGQSGGGGKVNFLMAMPSAAGLFHKAIVQSATPMTGNARTIEFSTRQTASMLRGLGVATVEQLQALPHDTLRDAYFAAGFQAEFELDARSRWNRLGATELRLIEFDFRQPARNVERLKTLLQTRYGHDERQAQMEVTRFSSRLYADNMGPIADGRVIVQAPFNPMAPDVSARVPVLVGHTLNEGGGPIFFTAAREQWTEAEMRNELATRPEPVPDGVVAGLREAYPTVRPVEIYAHTLNRRAVAGEPQSRPGRRACLCLHLCVADPRDGWQAKGVSSQ
jgi:para-nitrobenzyl esterase